jgi:hypothetical protein
MVFTSIYQWLIEMTWFGAGAGYADLPAEIAGWRCDPIYAGERRAAL